MRHQSHWVCATKEVQDECLPDREEHSFLAVPLSVLAVLQCPVLAAEHLRSHSGVHAGPCWGGVPQRRRGEGPASTGEEPAQERL